MKDLIRDSNNKVCTAKIMAWVGVITVVIKAFMQDQPDYSGLALFLSPFFAIYFGRNHTKAQK